jgi:hypothetical protein
MTNCLFAHGCVAMTGELYVRCHEPVQTGEELTVGAWIKCSAAPLHLLAAELMQRGRMKAAATANAWSGHEAGYSPPLHGHGRRRPVVDRDSGP